MTPADVSISIGLATFTALCIGWTGTDEQRVSVFLLGAGLVALGVAVKAGRAILRSLA